MDAGQIIIESNTPESFFFSNPQHARGTKLF
jgi:hypothetical protein